MVDTYSLTFINQIESKPVNWLWYPYIPSGKLTVIQGDPGDGKTTFILSLIAALSTGEALPLSEERKVYRAIYQNTEDDLADTIRPRLDRYGADCANVCFIEKETPLYLDDDCLEKAIVEAGAKLLVLDPLQAFVGENVDMNRANSIRPRLGKLKTIAEKTDCAIVLIGHLNKKSGGRADYRGLGSIDIQAAARSVLLVSKHEEYPNFRFVAQQKNNLAPLGETLAFTLKEGGVKWIGAFPLTVNELTNRDGGKPSKENKAIKIIANMLINGKVPADELIAVCAEEGVSERTVNNAKKRLKVKAVRSAGRWYWMFASDKDL